MSSDGVTRRTVIAGAGALAAAGAAPAGAAAASVRRLGEPGSGAPAAEVVGEVAQDGNGLTGYGYVTSLHGLSVAALFSGGRTEAAARLTFFATARATERFPHGALVSTVGRGTLQVHLGDGADFADPQSFAAGPVVARFDARLQNVASVVAPNQAVTAIEGELVQRAAPAFRLGGRRYRFGHRGLRLHLSAIGPGVRTNATPPRAVFDVAGRLHR
jgi:hypothetical protein